MHDLRFAVRQLLKNPGFTAVAVLTLALGIGANTAIFSVLNTIMLRPLPYPEPDRLVRVFRTSAQSQSWPHSPANLLDYREQNAVFESLAALVRTRFSLAEPGEPAESLRGIGATADFFPMIGVQAALGRVFTAEEDQPGRNDVVVLSHSFWVRRFGADTNIIGRRLRMDGENISVIGVMSAAAEYTQLWGPIDVWRPLALTQEQRQDRRDSWLMVVARLKKGVSPSHVDAAMKLVAARLADAYPEHNANYGLRVAPLHESIGDEASRRFAWLMLGLTAFVLLIACVNIANLQLARATARARELAVRLALGAGRARLIRQLLAESFIVALGGGLAGIVLASWLSELIGRRLTRWSPAGIDVALDSEVLLFALLCSVATALIFGVAPAWLASRTNMNDVLKAATRGATAGHSQNRLRHTLIIGEVALALVLLTGAGLFNAGLHQFIRQDPGWRVEGLLAGWVPLTSAKYSSPDLRRAFVNRLEERLSILPGVERASLSSSLPIWAFGTSRPFRIEGQTPPPLGQEPLVSAEAVTPGYFKTMDLRLRQGRLFTSLDTTNRPNVVIINEAMARRFWPNESPLGKRIGGYDRANPDPDWQEIVGVVKDIRFPANLSRPETPWQIYRPLAQEPRPGIIIELRTAGAPENLSNALRRAVAELDPDLPVNELEAARKMVDRMLEHFALAGVFLGAFAILGLVLAALGIYGVISYFVAQRTSEIGIRMALGAQMRDVLWLVLSKGLRLSLLGVAVGLAGAFAVVRLLSAAVPEIRTQDPWAFVGVVAILIMVTLIACWLPARRAAKVDPMEALRCE
jgi:putative ABC transport system permease protein